eukprot:gene24180-29244_t
MLLRLTCQDTLPGVDYDNANRLKRLRVQLGTVTHPGDSSDRNSFLNHHASPDSTVNSNRAGLGKIGLSIEEMKREPGLRGMLVRSIMEETNAPFSAPLPPPDIALASPRLPTPELTEAVSLIRDNWLTANLPPPRTAS